MKHSKSVKVKLLKIKKTEDLHGESQFSLAMIKAYSKGVKKDMNSIQCACLNEDCGKTASKPNSVSFTENDLQFHSHKMAQRRMSSGKVCLRHPGHWGAH
jgi:hypothetical protein